MTVVRPGDEGWARKPRKADDWVNQRLSAGEVPIMGDPLAKGGPVGSRGLSPYAGGAVGYGLGTLVGGGGALSLYGGLAGAALSGGLGRRTESVTYTQGAGKNFRTVRDFDTLYNTLQNYRDLDLAGLALGLEYEIEVTRDEVSRGPFDWEAGKTETTKYDQTVRFDPDERVYKELLRYEYDTRSAFVNSFFSWA